MPKDARELENWPELFHRELDSGKPWGYLPLKNIDWNSPDGKAFLKDRCRKGDGDGVIKHFNVLRLKDETALKVLGWVIKSGAPIENMPAEVTFRGGEEKCKALWDVIVDNNKGKEYLELLRTSRSGDNEKKLKAYDYVVSEYKNKKLGALPESKVIFGKFEEEEKEDRERQRFREEQKLMEDQNLQEEQRLALIKRRRSLLTKYKVDILTKELRKKGVSYMKSLWRADALGVIHHYIDADDVRAYPEFIEALTTVIDHAVEKSFEETYQCVRAFPLLYGGEVRYDVPPVIEKAFKKYSTMLRAVEKEFVEQLDPREKQDYFFFTKIAVTNPNFDWTTISLDRLPQNGAIVYNDNDEKVYLSMQEQLEEVLIAAHEAGVKDSVPEKYRSFSHAEKGVLTTLSVLWDWQEKQHEAAEHKTTGLADLENVTKKKPSWFGKLFGRKSEPA